MIPSRAYRRATSLVSVVGKTFRATTDFVAGLSITIGRAENMPPDQIHYMPATDGVTPMTLAELYQLRDAIAKKRSDALADEHLA